MLLNPIDKEIIKACRNLRAIQIRICRKGVQVFHRAIRYVYNPADAAPSDSFPVF
jgi:hypothetical protein